MPDPIQTQAQADASAAWLAQEHPEWNQQASSAEQAAAMNAAWQNNTAPVLPRMGTQYSGDQNETIRIYDTTGLTDPRNQQGVARDVTRSEYIQLYGRTPEQSEAAKYQEFNAPINFAAYANVPLSQMPANIASRVQDYYATNPSAAYREQIALYGRNVGTVATTGPAESYKQGSFAPTVAAGEGGFTGRAAAYAASWTPLVHSAMYGQESTIERTSVVAPPAMMDITIAPGRNVYVPIGETSQQLRADAKLVVAASGAYEVWQTPKNTMPGSEFVRIYPMITTGGSDYALQSGMISGKAATPVVYSEFGLQPLWKESEAARVADIQAHPEQYSRLGSELYGGIVQKLLPEPYNSIEVAWGRGQTVEPGVYPAVRQNYASLVNFEDVNAPKGTISNAADLPKFGAFSPEEYASMSSIQRVAIGGGLSPAMSEDLLPQPFRSTSTAAVAGTASTGSFSYAAPAEVSQAAGRPSTPLTVFGPEVEAWGKGAAGAVAAAIFPPVAVAAGVSKISGVMQPPTESAPVPGTDFVYRTDPAAVIMEGALFLGDYLPMGTATPGRDLLKSQGQAENPTADAFNTDFAKVTAQRETYTALGSTIETQRMGLDKMLEGKINAQGQFTGTASEYTQYQTSLADLNANVAKYNEYGDQYKDVLSKGFASGAIIKSGEGFVANPDNEHPYGAFSDWSASVTKTLRGGVTESDIIRYEQSPEFKEAGFITWAGEGSWKVLTNPTALAGTALQGVEIYAGMSIASAGFAAMAPAEFALSGAGAAVVPATLTESIGVTGMRMMANPYVQGAMGIGFVGMGVYEATDKFQAPIETSVSNVSGLVINLAAMGAGAMAPEGLAMGGEYAAVRFAEKPMSVETYKGTLSYTQQPDVMVPSGVGGEMKLTVEKTIATQPSVTVLGHEFAMPRVFEPKTRSVTTETTNLGYGDVGSLLEARLPGTKAEPLVGTRVENLRLESFRSQDLAHGTGDVSIAEVRLPRSIEEYQSMGKADARAAKMDPDELAASLMADATKVTEPTTGYRTMDVNVEKGTNIRDAFDWSSDLQGGTTHQMNRINIEDYFGQMQVTKTGDASAYQTTITRDVGEFGFGKTGQFDVTGARTPEARIVSQLQEVSGGLEKNIPERAFVFDQRGNLIYEEIGQIGSVSKQGALDVVFNQALEGKTTSNVHTHPEHTMRHIASAFTDTRILMSDKVRFAKDLISHGGSIVNKASEGDVDLMLDNPRFITEEYIVSDRFVMKFTPKEQIGFLTGEPLGWEAGFDTRYIGAKEVYRTSGYTERISDASPEMRAAFPEGTRNQFQNAVDRMALKNPNLEFIKEPQTTDVTYRAGRNPTGAGASASGYFRPGAQIAEVSPGTAFVAPEAIRMEPRGGSESVIYGIGSSREVVRTSSAAVAIESRAGFAPMTSYGNTKRYATGAVQEEVASDVVNAFVLPSSEITTVERQGVDRISAYDVIRAFDVGSDVRQTPDKTSDVARGLGLAIYTGQFQPSDVTQTPSQIPSQFTGQLPKQDVLQKQEPVQTPEQKPWQDIKPGPETPPPPTPPFLPLWGSVGGQAGGGGKKRGSRKYLEYFPVGLDISTFGVQRGANPFTSGLGRLKYLPRDVGVVSTPGVARERSNRLVERKAIAMKAIPVKGKRKNIFMK